jgi:predicted cupin superfamily sugar epimerase
MTSTNLIKYLQLQPHPEGGYYKETYRSSGMIASQCLPPIFGGDRHYTTAIYFLLHQGDFSAFHRIKSDECWHFYEGGTLLIHVIDPFGTYTCTQLGKNLDQGDRYQFVVPAGSWFASEPALGSDFALVGCTVSPGFDFADFELANADTLIENHLQHKELLLRLCR